MMLTRMVMEVVLMLVVDERFGQLEITTTIKIKLKRDLNGIMFIGMGRGMK